MNRTFDRIPSLDERNRDYPVSLLWNDAKLPEIVTKKWDDYAYLDQGPDGACVGFGISGELASAPEIIRGIDNTFAKQVYFDAQMIDEWPGGAYPGGSPFYEGTSVLAGAKVATNRGYYSSYYWAFDETDMARTVSNYGPVVIGVDWYDGMMEPDSDWYLHPTGSIVGGHCVVVIGINVECGYYIIRNSWGKEWGKDGEAKISREDMAILIARNGDVCKPTRVHIDPAPEPVPPTPKKKCNFWCKFNCWLVTGKWSNC